MAKKRIPASVQPWIDARRRQEKKQSKKAARVDARLMVDQRDDPTQ
jgi:hypothetical protein